jgi:hypothetical protein
MADAGLYVVPQTKCPEDVAVVLGTAPMHRGSVYCERFQILTLSGAW